MSSNVDKKTYNYAYFGSVFRFPLLFGKIINRIITNVRNNFLDYKL